HVNRCRTPQVAPEQADEQERRDGMARVTAEAEPRRNELVTPHRRSPARAAIAVEVAEVSNRAADVEEPLVLELHVCVGVERAVGRQPFDAPELPPVEVPERPLEDLRGLPPIHRRPGIPPLLIGPAQETEIVDLEAR